MGENSKSLGSLFDHVQGSLHQYTDDALAYLQAIPEGKALFDNAKANGFEVKYEPEFKKAGVDFAAVLDEKKIYFTNMLFHPAVTALYLGHEMRHVQQWTDHELRSSFAFDLPTTIRVSTVMEADAYTHDAVLAVKLLEANRDKPEVADALMPFFANSPVRRKVLEIAVEDPSALHDGRALAEGFCAYFTASDFRVPYEQAWAKQYQGFTDEDYQNKPLSEYSHALPTIIGELANSPDHYLTKHKPDLDWSDPLYCGMTTETHEAIDKHEARMQKLGKRVADSKKPPLFEPPLYGDPETLPGKMEEVKALWQKLKDREGNAPASAPNQAPAP